MPPSTKATAWSLMEVKFVNCISTATDIRDALSAAFGHMVEMATPVLTNYFGDLYFDARWLNENATGPSFTFLWSFNHEGTSIGFDSVLVLDRAHAYRITLHLDERRRAWLTIEHAAHDPRATSTTTSTTTATTTTDPADGTGSVSGALSPSTTIIRIGPAEEAEPGQGAA